MASQLGGATAAGCGVLALSTGSIMHNGVAMAALSNGKGLPEGPGQRPLGVCSNTHLSPALKNLPLPVRVGEPFRL